MEETTILEEKQEERQQIRSDFIEIGKTILFYFGLQIVFAFVLSLILLDAIEKENISLVQICSTLLTLLVSYLTLKRGMKKLSITKKDLRLVKSEWKMTTIVSYTMLAIGLSMLGSTVVLLINMLISTLQGITFVGPDFSMSGELGYDISMIVMILVVAPLFEELIFRGVILQTLLRYDTTFAILISGMLFGMMHMNLVQGIPTMLFGFVLAYVCIKSQSIIPCIIIHFINNLISFSAGYALSNEMVISLFGLVEIIFLIYAITRLCIGRKAIREELSTSLKYPYYKMFFSTWTILIFFVMVLLMTLTTFIRI